MAIRKVETMTEFLDAHDSLAKAAQALIYAQDNKPGEDLGASASAKCWVELRELVEAILGHNLSAGTFEAYLKSISET